MKLKRLITQIKLLGTKLILNIMSYSKKQFGIQHFTNPVC